MGTDDPSMLGIDLLVPEIMLGVGLAVFAGSFLAWVRGSRSRPKPYLMRNPSARPRHTEAIEGGEVRRTPAEAVSVNRIRTLFFIVVGLITTVWSLLSIVGRPS